MTDPQKPRHNPSPFIGNPEKAREAGRKGAAVQKANRENKHANDVERYFDMRSEGIEPSEAAKRCGWSQARLRELQRTEDGWIQREKDADVQATALVAEAYRAQALKGDARAAEKWLGTRSPERWDKLMPAGTNINVDARTQSIDFGGVVRGLPSGATDDDYKEAVVQEIFRMVGMLKLDQAPDPNVVDA